MFQAKGMKEAWLSLLVLLEEDEASSLDSQAEGEESL